jgi:NAD(P)H-flavin reductase/hemoglobin-like flavoprotein
VAIALDGGIPDEVPAGNPGLRAGLTRRAARPAPPRPHLAGKVPVQWSPPGRPRPASGEPPGAAAGPAGKETATAGYPAGPVDYHTLERSFATAGPLTDKVIAYFYSLLFTVHPELRSMFPLAMGEQRKRLAGALAHCAASMADPPSLAGYLAQLARDHRKYGVQEKHYAAFGETLVTALRLAGGPAWTGEAAAAWAAAVRHVCTVMAQAAHQAAGEPPWWVAEVVSHDRRGADLAVLTLRPSQPFPFQPGQYLSVQVMRWPRVWRNYSIGNAPRPDGTLDLHVRAIPGGQVSTALVQQTSPGDSVLLGPAQGSMTAEPCPARDMLCIAGGTGLAPIKAIIEGLAPPGPGRPGRRIRLFVGARRRPDLYDQPGLARLQAACPGLEVITALSEDPGASGVHGLLPDVVRMHASWHDHDVFVCGPPGMVRATLRMLAHRAPGGRVRLDPAAGAGPGPPG